MLHRRLPRVDVANHAYFLCCNLEARRRLFLDSALAQSIVDLYVSLRDQHQIDLCGYVVMPDHYHVLIGLRGSDSISQVLRGVHSLFVRQCRRRGYLYERTMQRRSYDHVIRDERDWLARLQYIHNNPVAAGLVEDAVEYPWSSCRFWMTGEGPVRCDGWKR